jgi:hypothetical protein
MQLHRYRSLIAALPILVASVAILFCVAVPAVSFTSECPRNDNRKILALKGEQPYGGPGEKFSYESRVESVDNQVQRFIYCVGNYRLYRSIYAKWFRDNRWVYFDSNVPPDVERPRYSDTTDKKYEVLPRTFEYDRLPVTPPPPDTVVRAIEVAQTIGTPNLTLRSAAVVDVAADPQTELLVASGKYEKYQPQSFVTMNLEFVSSLSHTAPGDNEVIANDLRLNFVGSIEHVKNALERWPKYLLVRDVNNAEFLLKTREPVRISGDNPPESKQISQVRLFAPSGKVVERFSVIEITDGKETVGSFGVSYFAPN